MRRWLSILAVVLVATCSFAGGSAHASAPPTPTTTPVETSPSLARPLEDCISAAPLPNCGHEPEQAGDRGGWMQWTLFGLMFLGLAFIGWRVIRGVRGRPGDA